MKKIIIAIDSFKGCLTSREAGEAIATGLKEADPECCPVVVPVADGGEGLLEALRAAHPGSRTVTALVHDPLMRPLKASYDILPDGRTALIETARASGLPLLRPEERNPLNTTTYGSGELIADALERGCREFIIGLGGSATNDAGTGLLQALGFRFHDRKGQELGTGEQKMCGLLLEDIASVDCTACHPALKECRFTAACDVRNPLHGPQGAAFVFAPQKGADGEMVMRLDRGLAQLAQVVGRQHGRDMNSLPGSGAAGGMGGGLAAFLDARLCPGTDLLLEHLCFSKRIEGACLIVTGEGKADGQTLMGKLPAGILREGRRRGIPVILLAGVVDDRDQLLRAGFHEVLCINPPGTLQTLALRPSFACRQLQKTIAEMLPRILP